MGSSKSQRVSVGARAEQRVLQKGELDPWEDDDSNDEFIVIYLRKAKERDGQCDVIFVVVRGDEKFPIVIIL